MSCGRSKNQNHRRPWEQVMTYDLESLEAKFSKLKVDSSTERYTTGKAPHKAVLLISLMLLDSDGRVDLGSFDPDLYLRDTWDEIWSRMDYPSPGNISSLSIT